MNYWTTFSLSALVLKRATWISLSFWTTSIFSTHKASLSSLIFSLALLDLSIVAIKFFLNFELFASTEGPIRGKKKVFKIKKIYARKKGVYLHQLVNMATNQLVGRNRCQTLKLVVNNYIIGWPSVVAGSSQTLFTTLPFPLERVVKGVKAATSRDWVGEDGAIWTDGSITVSPFSSPNFHFFFTKRQERTEIHS